jgi:hydroxyacylglutathione hydrolase
VSSRNDRQRRWLAVSGILVTFVMAAVVSVSRTAPPVAGPAPTCIYQDSSGDVQILFVPEVSTREGVDANCYAVVDMRRATAAVVDPGAVTGPRMLQDLQRRKIGVAYLLLTHGHGDHVGGIPSLLADTPARLVSNVVEVDAFSLLSLVEPSDAKAARDHCLLAVDRQVVRCGNIDIQVLSTPGHTVGSQCYYLPAHQVVFTGDTLLRGSVGRTDLPNSAGQDSLVEHVRRQLLGLPGAVSLLPGHGLSSSIEAERATNPYLVARNPATTRVAGY